MRMAILENFEISDESKGSKWSLIWLDGAFIKLPLTKTLPKSNKIKTLQDHLSRK